MKSRLLLPLFWILFASAPACGAVSDFQTWLGAFQTHNVSPSWLLYTEAQNRWSDQSTRENRLVLRAAAGYQVSRRLSFWAGYAWTPEFSPSFRDEHRLWQQSLTEYRWDHWELTFRFRLEERWIGGAGLAWRWREMLRAGYYPSASWGVVLWDEFFFNFNTNSVVSVRGFGENRLFLGLSIPVAKGMSLEPGYQNTLLRSATSALTQNENIAALYFFWVPERG